MPSHFGCVQLFASLWAIVRQAPLSMGFSRQEYWSGFPFPPPGDLPDPGIELASLMSPVLAGGFFTTSATWKPKVQRYLFVFGVPRPNIAHFLSGHSCLLPGFIMCPMYLTCCFEILCLFLGDPITLGPKEIKNFNGVLI